MGIDALDRAAAMGSRIGEKRQHGVLGRVRSFPFVASVHAGEIPLHAY